MGKKMTSTGTGRWRRRGGLALIAAIGVSIGMAPGTASAYNSYTGAAYVKDSWSTSSAEGVVNLNTNDQSGATCLWQAILWADGAWIADKGRRFYQSDIDGIFGWDSHQATRSWQNRHGLSVDGSAGKYSWARAERQLTYWSGGGDTARTYYRGKKPNGADTGRGFWLTRDSQGRWSFDEPGTGRNIYASYETSTKKSRCL